MSRVFVMQMGSSILRSSKSFGNSFQKLELFWSSFLDSTGLRSAPENIHLRTFWPRVWHNKFLLSRVDRSMPAALLCILSKRSPLGASVLAVPMSSWGLQEQMLHLFWAFPFSSLILSQVIKDWKVALSAAWGIIFYCRQCSPLSVIVL